MKKAKTEDEKLWDYLTKKIGHTKTAKEIFNKVTKKTKPQVIAIEYKIDSRPIEKSVVAAKRLVDILSKIKIQK